MPQGRKPTTKAGQQAKAHKVMHEFGKGALHSGSKHGPVVTNPKQAVAIAMSESGQAKPKPGRPSAPSDKQPVGDWMRSRDSQAEAHRRAKEKRQAMLRGR